MRRTAWLCALCVSLLIFAACGAEEKVKSLEKNYGWSHGTVNIGAEGTETLSVDEIVPHYEELIANLEKAGFETTKFETALGSDIAASRVLATKDELFFDICYGLTEEQAKEIFTNYASEYDENEFYVLAQNEEYVYAASDERTFADAGFETLETVGTLFVWE